MKELISKISSLNSNETAGKKFVDGYYKRMGIIDEFDEYYPFLREYAVLILVNIPKIEASDFVFVATKLDDLVKKHKDATHLRISTEIEELASYRSAILYSYLVANGCCDKIDEQIINPKTNNMFIIGCSCNHKN